MKTNLILKAKKTKEIGLSKKEVEKRILDFQDLLMRYAQKKGLLAYNVAESIKHFEEIRNCIKYAVEDELGGNNEVAVSEAIDPKKRLDLSTDKKYNF